MRIIEDTKTTKTTIAKSESAGHSTRDAQRKIRIHVTCIIIAGVVSTVLFQLRVGNSMTLGFGPIVPSIAQEIFDRILHL